MAAAKPLKELLYKRLYYWCDEAKDKAFYLYQNTGSLLISNYFLFFRVTWLGLTAGKYQFRYSIRDLKVLKRLCFIVVVWQIICMSVVFNYLSQSLRRINFPIKTSAIYCRMGNLQLWNRPRKKLFQSWFVVGSY